MRTATLNKLILLLLLQWPMSGLYAQLVDGNVFLQGNYVEVGVANNGSYGSTVNAPVGYHARPGGAQSVYNPATGIAATLSGILGFVADPQKDGWTVGTPYTYMGDYYMPGSPQEGWKMQVGSGPEGIAYFPNLSGFGAPTGYTGGLGLTGSNTGYINTSTDVTGIWEGNTSTGLYLRQETKILKDKAFFTVKITIKNTTTSSVSNVYYTRTVDPDNDVALGGSFVTTNTIDYQLPNADGNVLVSAKGTAALGYPYLGLGSRDCRAKCYIVTSGLTPSATTSQLFEQTGGGVQPYDSGTVYTNDVGIGIVFRVPEILPGDSTSFSYAYILSADDLEEALISTVANPVLIEPTTGLTLQGVTGVDTGIVVRGCMPGTFNFHLNIPQDTPKTIHFTIGGTAVPGVDYVPIADSVTFPPGDTVVNVAITGIPVFPPVGPKTVVLTASTPVDCGGEALSSESVLMLLDSLPVQILTPSDTFCFGGSRDITIQHYLGDSAMTYLWTPSIGVYNTSDPETSIYPPPGGMTTYTLHGFYPGFACDTVTAKVSFYTSPLTVDAGPDLDRCANEPAILLGSVTPALAGTTITWSPGATLSDSTIAAPSATTFTTTTYHLNVTDFIGCTYTDSMTLNITGVSSSLDVFADKDIVCPGESVTLGAVLGGLQPCGLATIPNPCAGATTNTQYAGTATLTTKSPSPFFESNASSGDRLQILYTKEELRAQGVTPGYINAMAFNVAVKNSLPTDSFKNYTIRLACTDTATLRPGAFPLYSGMATVFPPTTVATTTGWNNFAFPTPYYWDGSSNLVAEICWNKTPGSGSAATDELYVSGSGYNSVLWLGGAYSGTAPCTADGAAANQVSNLRPNTRFSICSPAEYTYTWSATPAASFSDPTSLTPSSSGLQSTTTFTLTSAPVASPTCTSTGTVTVQVDNSTSVDILLDDPFIQCEAGLVTLNATATGMPFYSNLACGTSGAVSCSSPQAATVGATGGASRIGSPLAGDSRSARTQFIITREELLSSGMQSSTLRGLSLYVAQVAGTDPYANFTIKLGCTPKEQYSSSTDYAGGLTQVYSSSSFVPASGAWNTFSFTTPYNWDSTQNLVVEICSERATPASAADELWVSGTNEYRSIQYRQPTGGGACTAAPNPASSGAYALRPTVRFSYCLPTPQPLPYVWTPGTGLSDSTAQSPSVYVNEGDGPLHYTVSTYDRNGCRASDDITIIIPVHEYTITPEDTTICKGERISIAVSGEGITSWQWYEGAVGNQSGTLSCVDCPAPIAGPQGETTYYVVANDQYNCPETLSTHIALYPEPDIRILTADTLIKFGQSAGLMATGGVAYSWQPAGSLSDPRLPNPVASPVTTTDYVVVGVDEHGCKGMDTVRVAIDYRDSLLVPTAFTPNGDGRNDVFRVANLSFQKLIEFRVFNRWGQEVYSTTDNNGGWDGTWKGVAQDMGIYTYIIRVAFPDGTVSTYKGDVTLIR